VSSSYDLVAGQLVKDGLLAVGSTKVCYYVAIFCIFVAAGRNKVENS
jgi:hypothetical protein